VAPYRRRAFGRCGRIAGIVVAVAALLAGSLLGPAARPVQAAGDVGYQDGSYSGSAPTGREPQSKLWFNDGSWWASMYSSAAGAVDIHRLNWATQTWTDTGVRIDERSKSSADTLWDGTKLYVTTAVSDQSLSCTPSTSGDLTVRVLRYSYDSGARTYTLDAGFPVTIANAGLQALSMAKDGTGTIWVTWGYPSGSHGNVFITHSTSDTAHYVTPYVLPLAGVTTMECPDYSAMVAYNGRIGVMWSNQTESGLYFGIHVDGDPDSSWTRSVALSGTGWADNHVNVKSLQADASGQVFAATKTSLNGDQCPPSQANAQNPLILLVYMDGTGAWQRRTFSTAADCESRPLVLLNQTDRKLYLFATQPAPNSSYGSGGSIMYKETSLDSPNFASGPGTPFIQLAADPKINNVSGTKQTVNGSTGLVVIASDDSTHHYVHNAISIGGADTTPPTITSTTPTGGASNVSTSSVVTATFSEPMASATVNGSSFTLTDTTTSTSVPASVGYDGASRTATLTPGAALAAGHAFTARVVGGAGGVTDLAGNPMTSDATWSFSTSAPSGPLFTDGFESGNFSAWTLVRTGGDGTATVQTAIVKSGTYAARFTESTGKNSFAYARATLPADQNELTVSSDVEFATQGSSGTVPVLRLFDAGGIRRFSLDRQNGSGALSFTDGAGTVALGGSLPVATWGHLDVHLVSGAGTALVEIQFNGSLIYSNRARTLTAMRTLQIGNDTKKQTLNAYVDNVTISAPGGGPTAPDTTITSGPSGTVNSTSATFAFTSTVGGSTFGCSLDGGAATACSSPASYTGLPEGSHTFTVAATANGLTDPTPASQTWGIDLTPPGITSTTPADGAIDVAPGATLTATFSEPMASNTVTGTTFALADSTNGGSSVAASVAYNATSHVATLTPSTPLAASHTFTATVRGGPGGVTDSAGNAMTADVTWSFTTSAPVADTTPPTVALTAPANGSSVSGTAVTISANASDNVAVDHVDFLVNGAVVGTDASNPYSITWNSTTVQNGTATITAHAVDTSSNVADSTINVSVQNGVGGPLFADDFESGTLGAWTLVRTGADGTATVQSAVVKSGTYAAQLTETATSGSFAYTRETLSADQSQLTVSGDFQITTEGTSAQNVPIIRLFDAAGTRRVSLFRQSQAGNKIYIGYNGTNYSTTGLLPLGTWGHFDLKVVAGSGAATVEVRLNGTLIYATAVGTVPAIRTLQIGNETAAQPMGTYVDNLGATTP
jgi:archaellum component FlaF (FlaF/FlaG flagellin family)